MSKVNANALEAEAMENVKGASATATPANAVKMNIYEKVQAAKLSLTEANLKKSGHNKFANFEYYELGDFMPAIIKIFNDLKLFSKVTFTNETAVLKIINAENPMEQEEYTSPMKELDIKGANPMQSLGGIETYQRRYLYMSALDITEGDMFDGSGNGAGAGNNSNNSKTEPPAPKKQPDQTPPPQQPAAQTGTKKASEAQVKMIHDLANDITKGYAAINQKALPEAILNRMRESLKLLDKEITDFLVADASKAIDYLADIKVKIPKPQQPPAENADVSA